MLDPPGRTVVAVAPDGTILGSAKMNPNHGGPASHVASASFMVDPAHAGQGVGRALGRHSLEWARTEGYRAMQFNAVAKSNTRAVALWQSLGWVQAPEPGLRRTAHHVPQAVTHDPPRITTRARHRSFVKRRRVATPPPPCRQQSGVARSCSSGTGLGGRRSLVVTPPRLQPYRRDDA